MKPIKTRRVMLCLAGGLIISPTAMSQVFAPPPILTPSGDPYVPIAAPPPVLLFTGQFDDWEDNHVHWRGPSKVEIYSDGRVVATANYLANMRRTSVIDTGDAVYFCVILEAKNDSGNIVWSDWFQIDFLPYKQISHGVRAEATIDITAIRQGYQLGAAQYVTTRSGLGLRRKSFSP